MLAEDGAGRPSARLPNPAGPQAAFPRDPGGGSVTVPSAGITHIHTLLFLHVLRKVNVFIIHLLLSFYYQITIYCVATY